MSKDIAEVEDNLKREIQESEQRLKRWLISTILGSAVFVIIALVAFFYQYSILSNP